MSFASPSSPHDADLAAGGPECSWGMQRSPDEGHNLASAVFPRGRVRNPPFRLTGSTASCSPSAFGAPDHTLTALGQGQDTTSVRRVTPQSPVFGNQTSVCAAGCRNPSAPPVRVARSARVSSPRDHSRASPLWKSRLLMNDHRQDAHGCSPRPESACADTSKRAEGLGSCSTASLGRRAENARPGSPRLGPVNSTFWNRASARRLPVLGPELVSSPRSSWRMPSSPTVHNATDESVAPRETCRPKESGLNRLRLSPPLNRRHTFGQPSGSGRETSGAQSQIRAESGEKGGDQRHHRLGKGQLLQSSASARSGLFSEVERTDRERHVSPNRAQRLLLESLCATKKASDSQDQLEPYLQRESMSQRRRRNLQELDAELRHETEPKVSRFFTDCVCSGKKSEDEAQRLIHYSLTPSHSPTGSRSASVGVPPADAVIIESLPDEHSFVEQDEREHSPRGAVAALGSPGWLESQPRIRLGRGNSSPSSHCLRTSTGNEDAANEGLKIIQRLKQLVAQGHRVTNKQDVQNLWLEATKDVRDGDDSVRPQRQRVLPGDLTPQGTPKSGCAFSPMNRSIPESPQSSLAPQWEK